MKRHWEIRLAGTGGQGLLLAGVILAEAAAIHDDKNAVQSQTYGPQARGGLSKSELIISEEEIDFPRVLAPDIFLAMSQDAADNCAGDVRRDAMVICDSELVNRLPTRSAYAIPITAIARQATGQTLTASVVALAVLAELTGVVSREALLRAVAHRVPRGSEEVNCKAVEAGFKAAAEYRVALEAKVHSGSSK